MVRDHTQIEREKCVVCWSGFPLQGVHQFESPWLSDMSTACLWQSSHRNHNCCVLLITLNCLWRTGEGDQRGVNESQSKFLVGNLACILKSIWRSSLLTRLRPHRYREAIGSQNWVRNRSGNTNRCCQEHVWDWWQKSDQKSIQVILVILANNLCTWNKERGVRSI
jgi:hypothetical protein